jgi:hypothetical protein
LQPTVGGHLELLREKQGDGQVTKQQDGQNQGNDGGQVDLHGLPQLLAGLDVKKRQAEENYREQQHDSILHSNSRISVSRPLEKPPAQESFWLTPSLSIDNLS